MIARGQVVEVCAQLAQREIERHEAQHLIERQRPELAPLAHLRDSALERRERVYDR